MAKLGLTYKPIPNFSKVYPKRGSSDGREGDCVVKILVIIDNMFIQCFQVYNVNNSGMTGVDIDYLSKMGVHTFRWQYESSTK